ASALYLETAQLFLPVAVGALDRARALEIGMERAWAGAIAGDTMVVRNLFDESFYAVHPDSSHPHIPALFLNTTSVETGERMVVSSHLLDTSTSTNVIDLSQLSG